MFAKDGNKRKTREDVDTDNNKRIRHQPPPFLTHFKNSSGTKYTVGDKREWNNHVFYFCDAPTHKDRAKWHTHTADTCRISVSVGSKAKNPDKTLFLALLLMLVKGCTTSSYFETFLPFLS